MRLKPIVRILFILYCVEAGAIFLLVPWSVSWERLVHQLSLSGFGPFWFHPLFRSAISAFGVVHLVWGAHDLDLLLSHWGIGGRSSS